MVGQEWPLVPECKPACHCLLAGRGTTMRGGVSGVQSILQFSFQQEDSQLIEHSIIPNVTYQVIEWLKTFLSSAWPFQNDTLSIRLSKLQYLRNEFLADSQQCYEPYKPAIETVLNTLFTPDDGLTKSCKGIEQQVHFLASSKQKFKQPFFKALGRAIWWRQQAAEEFHKLQHCDNSKSCEHAYFLKLLSWIHQVLTVKNSGNEHKVTSINSIFVSLSMENSSASDTSAFLTLSMNSTQPTACRSLMKHQKCHYSKSTIYQR